MLLDPVIRDADVLVARGDGVDRGPFLGGDVVTDEDGRSRDDFRDADGVEDTHVDVDAPRR